MKYPALFFLCLLFAFSSYSQTYPESDFTKTPIPKAYSTEWYKLNYSPNAFAVSVNAGKLQITKVKATFSNHHEYNLRGGKLISIDNGEWGGGLYYKPDDDTEKTVYVNGKSTPVRDNVLRFPRENPINTFGKGSAIIAGGNMKYFFTYHNSIYVVGGLAHMSIDTGRIIRVDAKDNTFGVSVMAEFSGAPMASAIYKNQILMVTFDRFYVINNWKKELIFNNTFWASLYPNSIAVIGDNQIYVGIRSGYVKIDLKEKTMEFYKYNG